ncbi:MAG: hypothetical protein RIR59_494 [Pseudomonadota bacterium]
MTWRLWMAGLALAASPATAALVTSSDAGVIAAAADADHDRNEAHLKLLCKTKTEGGIISFVAGSEGKVLLAALSAKPLKDVRKDIWLSPRFTSPGKGRAATSATEDWAYLYDHNGDGRIDRMSFLIGPLPTEPDTHDPRLPNIAGDQVRIEGADMMARVMKAMRYGFWQAADEDADGMPDIMAMPARRKDTGWYRGWAIFDRRATTEDASCRFIDRDGSAKGPCHPGAEIGDYEGESLTARVWVRDPGPIFSAIQDAALACKLGAEAFRR